MGSYNTAVITTVGQALLTSVLGAQGTMTFTKLQTSSYAYASGTDLSALTSLNNVEQEVNVTADVIDSTHIYANALISNTGVSTEYSVNTLGIFASDGNSEVLFAVSTAETPDVIPVDSGGTPSTYKYKFNLAVSSTSDITITGSGEIDAADVDYTNTVSGLSATTVQGAIDELAVLMPSGDVATQDELGYIESGNTATTAHAKGSTFVWKKDFVRAKTDIASGATFTLNTNVEKKSVSDILNAIKVSEVFNIPGMKYNTTKITSNITDYITYALLYPTRTSSPVDYLSHITSFTVGGYCFGTAGMKSNINIEFDANHRPALTDNTGYMLFVFNNNNMNTVLRNNYTAVLNAWTHLEINNFSWLCGECDPYYEPSMVLLPEWLGMNGYLCARCAANSNPTTPVLAFICWVTPYMDFK